MESVPAVVFLAHDPECRRITGSRRAYEILRLPLSSDGNVEGYASLFGEIDLKQVSRIGKKMDVKGLENLEKMGEHKKP